MGLHQGYNTAFYMLNILKKIKLLFKKLNPYKVPFILYLMVLITVTGLYKWQPTSPILITPNKVVSDWSHQPTSCWDSFSAVKSLSTNCKLDVNRGNILLLGDSHAQQLVFGFENAEKKTNVFSSKKVILLTSHLMRGNWRSPVLYKSDQIKYIRSVLAKTTENDFIIFSVTSRHIQHSIYGHLKLERGIQISLAKLLASILYTEKIQGKIILMLDTPHLKNNVARLCVGKEGPKMKLCELNFDDYVQQNSYLMGAYDHLKSLSTVPQLFPMILDPLPFFCKKEKCSLFDESGFMLIDGNHIRMSVSHRLVKELFSEIM
jgi:hypothetical protein